MEKGVDSHTETPFQCFKMAQSHHPCRFRIQFESALFCNPCLCKPKQKGLQNPTPTPYRWNAHVRAKVTQNCCERQHSTPSKCKGRFTRAEQKGKQPFRGPISLRKLHQLNAPRDHTITQQVTRVVLHLQK